MTTLRAAAQQALEFCELLWREVVLNDWEEGQREAVEAALRAALAGPVQEPVAWRITDGEGDWEYCTELPEQWSIEWSARYNRKYEPLYTAPPQRKPLVDPAEYDDAGAAERYNRGLK